MFVDSLYFYNSFRLLDISFNVFLTIEIVWNSFSLQEWKCSPEITLLHNGKKPPLDLFKNRRGKKLKFIDFEWQQ